MKSDTTYKYLSVYWIVNVIYLLGLLIISLVYRIYPELLFPRFLAFIPISLTLYLLTMLPYLHIVYYIAYSFVYVRRFTCDKCPSKVIFTLCFSIAGILLNIYWIVNGKPFLVN